MQKQREHWSSHIGFMLAAAGSAIGLGTLWKFPYVTGQNGGGLFVLIYIACVFFIGIPLFMGELILGRRAQRGAVGVFQSLSHGSGGWKAVGWMGVAASFLIMTYYSVIAGWSLNYVLMSLNQFWEGRTPEEISGVFDTLSGSADITIFWHAVFTLLTASVVYPGVRQGIEYWAKIMTSTLLVLLLVLFCYSFQLDGFGEALHFIFYPDPTEFTASSALEALGLAFFTLSLGQGIMLTYGSYMRRRDDIPKTGLIIGTTIVGISLLAGMTIFPIIFTFGFEPAAGEGLAFKTMPVLFAKLPGALLISTTFFVLLVGTALTSSVALVEVVSANFIDLYGWTRHRAVIVVAIACFVCGIPSALSSSSGVFDNWSEIYGKTFFMTIDDLVTVWLLPIGGLCTCIFVGWRLDEEIGKSEFRSGSIFPMFWRPWFFFIRYIAPVAIVLILLQKSGVIDIDTWIKA